MTVPPADKTDKTDKTPVATLAKVAAEKQYWERVTREILEAMRALPLREFEPGEITLEQHAFSLSNTAGFALVNRLAMANRTRKKDGIKKEAEAIRDAAAKLHQLLQQTHGDTLAALEQAAVTDPQPNALHPLQVADTVRALANLAHVAFLDAPSQRAQPGSKNKQAAAQVADMALRSFEQLTGRRAARTWDAYKDVDGGPFVDFLAAVFRALGMKDSAPSQAKEAISRRAGDNPPEK
ncbi:hypothetical protein [Sandarakinorhabdus sp.]|uniref:hypothetical protein n=1 Tax=Sandarakinorhabdus sp. TaxID=1916663 RepID=UPI003F716FDF